MAVRRDKKTGGWIVEFQQSGERVLRRLPRFATKADATALEVRYRREIFEREGLGRKAEPSLAAAIQLWLEQATRDLKDQRKPKQNAALLAPYVTGKRLRQAPEAAQEAREAWRELAPGTINRRLAVLKAACRHAFQQGWIPENLSGRIRPLREENRREVYLSAREVDRLAKAAESPAIAAAVMVAAYTGLRASELLALTPTSVRLGSLLVPKSKGGKPRLVPVVKRIRPHLKALPIGLSYWQLRNGFDTAKAKAGLPGVRFHDLRHTCASLLAQQGVDLYVIGRILGHASPQTTARYSHLADKTLRAAMRKIG